jgi:hypothetical protein
MVNPVANNGAAGHNRATGSKRMTRVACLMMLRDEDLLAELWLLHHGDLFGFENLYVYDNGSVSEAVLTTLRKFAARGANVDFSHSLPEDYGAKGAIATAKIQEFQRGDRYDIVLPLDCDEFVAVTGPDGPSLRRADIMAELTRIHEAGAICVINRCYYNVPGYLDLFWYAWYHKSVIPVAKFTWIDHGFHLPALPDGEAFGQTSLIHIHLHCKPFALVQHGAQQKLSTRTNVADRAALRGFKGHGDHLVKYLLMTAAQYYCLFQEHRKPFIGSGFLLRHFAALTDVAAIQAAWEAGRPATGHDNPLVLDLDATPLRGEDYLAANSDLAGVHPFRHFLDTGYSEARPMDGTEAGAAELAGRIAVLREGAAKSLARRRDYAVWAMERGRFDEAVPHWDEYLRLCPDDREAYNLAVIARREAGKPTDDIIAEAAARFPGYPGFG